MACIPIVVLCLQCSICQWLKQQQQQQQQQQQLSLKKDIRYNELQFWYKSFN